jgi:hypothetical protein
MLTSCTQGQHSELSGQLSALTASLAALQNDVAARDAELKAKAVEIASLQSERAELAQRLYGHTELQVRAAPYYFILCFSIGHRHMYITADFRVSMRHFCLQYVNAIKKCRRKPATY